MHIKGLSTDFLILKNKINMINPDHTKLEVCSIYVTVTHGSSVSMPEAWPRGYKTFFVLNSGEHEILNAHKYKNINKFGLFKAQLSLECYFSPLIHVKMPTIVGILTFMSGENFMLN